MAATSATSGPRSFGRRAAVAIAAVLLASTGVWFAASWVDTSYDWTCGAVIHPDLWVDDASPDTCRGVMVLRAAVSAALLAASAGLTYIAVTGRRLTRSNAAVVLAIVFVTCACLLVVNEVVRSDGAL